jgi:hypothetical protein
MSDNKILIKITSIIKRGVKYVRVFVHYNMILTVVFIFQSLPLTKLEALTSLLAAYSKSSYNIHDECLYISFDKLFL